MKKFCFSCIFFCFCYHVSFAKILIIDNAVDERVLYEKFFSLPNYDSALMLAKYFYFNKDYENAILWSLEANDFDKNKKNAWEIFIKSKLKQGKEAEALRALKEYDKIK